MKINVLATLSLLLMTSTTLAGKVENACASDFISLCGQFKPHSLQGDACMRKNAVRLSPTCQKALVSAGYRR